MAAVAADVVVVVVLSRNIVLVMLPLMMHLVCLAIVRSGGPNSMLTSELSNHNLLEQKGEPIRLEAGQWSDFVGFN